MDKYSRVLVVANETIAGESLHRQINEMTAEDGEVLVVAPALSSRLEYVFSDVDKPREHAQARLDRSLELMAADGVTAKGLVGDANPVRALEDALAIFDADAVLVSTHPEGRSHWLERGVVEKFRAHTSLPVIHVVVDIPAEEAERKTRVA